MSKPPSYRALDEPSSVDETVRRHAQFDAAVTRSRGDLFSYLRRRTRDTETAADLTQETFSRMMVYRDASNIESYVLLMYRIAHNLVLELQRSRYRRHASHHIALSLAEPLYSNDPPVEEIADGLSLDLLLKQTLMGLPVKCRLAFMLSRYEGLTYPQVATKMGISVKMVEKHISKALLAFRAAVGGRNE